MYCTFSSYYLSRTVMTTLRFLPRVERDAALLLGSAHVNRDGSSSSTLSRYEHCVLLECQWTLFHGRNLIPRVQILTALVPHTARDPGQLSW